MQLNDIFNYEEYDIAYNFVENNQGTTIVELETIYGQRKFQIVTVVESTDENVEYIDE